LVHFTDFVIFGYKIIRNKVVPIHIILNDRRDFIADINYVTAKQKNDTLLDNKGIR